MFEPFLLWPGPQGDGVGIDMELLSGHPTLALSRSFLRSEEDIAL